MFKDYKVCSKNSTVCGYPGRDYDWSKFSWNEEGSYDFGDEKYSKECDDKKLRGKKIGVMKAPKVFVDSCSMFIANDCQYLHVPYAFSGQATIYRVRPNESMEAGKIYRGKLIKKQTAIKKEDGWYWRLEFEDGHV